MKPPICLECIVRPLCTTMCETYVIDLSRISNELRRNQKFIYSKKTHKRKHIKEKHMKHYNKLLRVYNTYIYEYGKIFDRTFANFLERGIITPQPITVSTIIKDLI